MAVFAYRGRAGGRTVADEIEADSRPSELNVISSARRESSDVSSRKISTCVSSFAVMREKRGITSGTSAASAIGVWSIRPE